MGVVKLVIVQEYLFKIEDVSVKMIITKMETYVNHVQVIVHNVQEQLHVVLVKMDTILKMEHVLNVYGDVPNVLLNKFVKNVVQVITIILMEFYADRIYQQTLDLKSFVF